jgi:hypothetical protein
MSTSEHAPISSIEGFFREIWDLQTTVPVSDVTLFRGQAANYPLLPKLFREPNKPDLVEKVEQKILDTLKQAAPYLLPSQPDNDWDWLSLGQHYGMPTRLTDWTENPLIALFFAVETRPPEGRRPIVYRYPAINERIEETDKIKKSPFDIPHTRVMKPTVHSQRADAQAAWHIVHAVHETNGDRAFIPLDAMHPHGSAIQRFEIDPLKIESLREELSRIGIRHSTVYGDLQSICRSIGPAFGIV